MVAARGGTGQARARRKRVVTEQSLASPCVCWAFVAKEFVWLLCALQVLRERTSRRSSRQTSRNNQGIVGVERVLLSSVVFKTASRTDGFPGSICTEGVSRY